MTNSVADQLARAAANYRDYAEVQALRAGCDQKVAVKIAHERASKYLAGIAAAYNLTIDKPPKQARAARKRGTRAKKKPTR